MTAVWIALLLSAAAIAFVVASRRQHVHMAELGAVSQQWLAEQRANDRHYSER